MAESLDGVSLFSGLDAGQRAVLARAMVDMDLPAGHVMFRQGEKAGGTVGLYVLRSGSLTVSVARPKGGFATIREVVPGEVVGVIGLVNPDSTRTGTVVAGAPSRVSHLSRTAFLALYHSSAPLACAFQLALARQLVQDLRVVDGALRDAISRKTEGVPLGAIHLG
jgi:CRP-like cAMP-binding protein